MRVHSNKGRFSRVLDVGNCDPDHAAIRRLLEPLDVDVDRVMFVDEAISALREKRYDLVLVNRLIFADSSDGLPLIERMQADPSLKKTPVMMVSNYDDAQDRAVAAGAVRGFGKAALNEPTTLEMLKPYVNGANPSPTTPISLPNRTAEDRGGGQGT